MTSEIVVINKNAVIAYKPAGVLSESDAAGGDSVISHIKEALEALGENTALYPVHRLDRAVGGLMVLARNRQSAAALSQLVSEEGFGKEYLAVVEGVPGEARGEFFDRLSRDKLLGKAIRKENSKDSKDARLTYELLATGKGKKGEVSLVKVSLQTGRFHQIRAQFSLRGMPLVGDAKYGSRDRYARTPSLFCHTLSLELFGEHLSADKLPPLDVYPWSLFSEHLTSDKT